MNVYVRIKLGDRDPLLLTLGATEAATRVRFGCSLGASVVAHASVAALLLLMQWGTGSQPVYRVTSIEHLEVRVPLFLPPQSRPMPPVRVEPPARREARAEPEIRVQPGKRFELPVSPRPVQTQQALIQPDFPNITPPLNTRLPQVMFWSQEPIRPRPPARKFIAPGNRERPQTPLLQAEPKLDPPNREPRVSDLSLAAAALDRPPALPVPPATTAPVRTFVPPTAAAPKPVSIAPFEGEPSRLVALNDQPAPLSPTFTVPAGNLVPPPSPAAGGDPTSAGVGVKSEGVKSEGVKSDRGSERMAGTASKGAPVGPQPGRGSGRAGEGSPVGGSRADGGGSARGSRTDGKAGEEMPGGSAAVSSSFSALPPPVKMVHPENGVFDVVVLQSFDVFKEAAGVLRGRPIYTVYLKVGAPRDWIMQFCSGSSAIVNSGGVVRLGNPAPLLAPYPRVTAVPPAGAIRNHERIILHGFLDTSGRFRDLLALQKKDAEAGGLLLSYLKQWEFRPATRDGRPVEIELLLVVPSADSP